MASKVITKPHYLRACYSSGILHRGIPSKASAVPFQYLGSLQQRRYEASAPLCRKPSEITRPSVLSSLRAWPVTSPKRPIQVVDSINALFSLLDNLTRLPTDDPRPSLFIDLQGDSIGRNGTISVLTLFVVRPMKTIYLVDIHKLGANAFKTTHAGSGASLQTILESATIPKVVFDVRNDSDALFAHYSISLGGVQDLQLMELATRKSSKRLVSGLAKCIQVYTHLDRTKKEQWKKRRANQKWNQKMNYESSYEFLHGRPLKPEVIRYCFESVALLRGLYRVINRKLDPAWKDKVQSATKDRIEHSKSADFEGRSKRNALGPCVDGREQYASE